MQSRKHTSLAICIRRFLFAASHDKPTIMDEPLQNPSSHRRKYLGRVSPRSKTCRNLQQMAAYYPWDIASVLVRLKEGDFRFLHAFNIPTPLSFAPNLCLNFDLGAQGLDRYHGLSSSPEADCTAAVVRCSW